MRRLAKLVRRLSHPDARRGIAALEFGLLAPLFLLLLAAVVDFSAAYTAKSLLDATVSSAANYTLLNAATLPDDATLALNVGKLVANSSSIDHWFNVVVKVNNGATSTVTNGVSVASGSANASCYCPTTGTTPSVTPGTVATCGATCPDGGLAGNFVSIVATYVYVPIFHGFSFVPNGTMTASAVVQTR